MKTLIVSVIVIGVLLASCTDNERESDLSGTYVNKSQSEYSIAFDTLIVLKKANSNYQVERKTGFQKIRNGLIQSKEYKSETWLAQWDPQKMVLSETALGRQISQSEGGKSISLKNTEYLKIK